MFRLFKWRQEWVYAQAVQITPGVGQEAKGWPVSADARYVWTGCLLEQHKITKLPGANVIDNSDP